MTVAATIATLADNSDLTAADVRSVFSSVHKRATDWTPVLETTAPADFSGFTVDYGYSIESGFPGLVFVAAHLSITSSATIRGIKGLPTIDSGYQFAPAVGSPTARWNLVGQCIHHYSGFGYYHYNLSMYSDTTLRFQDVLSNSTATPALGNLHDLAFWALLPTEAV